MAEYPHSRIIARALPVGVLPTALGLRQSPVRDSEWRRIARNAKEKAPSL